MGDSRGIKDNQADDPAYLCPEGLCALSEGDRLPEIKALIAKADGDRAHLAELFEARYPDDILWLVDSVEHHWRNAVKLAAENIDLTEKAWKYDQLCK